MLHLIGSYQHLSANEKKRIFNTQSQYNKRKYVLLIEWEMG